MAASDLCFAIATRETIAVRWLGCSRRVALSIYKAADFAGRRSYPLGATLWPTFDSNLTIVRDIWRRRSFRFGSIPSSLVLRRATAFLQTLKCSLPVVLCFVLHFRSVGPGHSASEPGKSESDQGSKSMVRIV